MYILCFWKNETKTGFQNNSLLRVLLTETLKTWFCGLVAKAPVLLTGDRWFKSAQDLKLRQLFKKPSLR